MRDRRSFTRAPIGAAAFLYTGWAAAPVTRRFTGGACAAATSAGALTATIANAMMRFICPPLDAIYRHPDRMFPSRRRRVRKVQPGLHRHAALVDSSRPYPASPRCSDPGGHEIA